MNPLSRSSVGQTFKQETFFIEDPNNMQDICYVWTWFTLAGNLFLFSLVIEYLGKNEKEMVCLTNIIL